MNASDRQYLSRFALDPAMEFKWEDLYDLDFYCPDDEEMNPFDAEKDMDAEDPIPEDDSF